jgi:PAS domain S-box-containing protein
VSANFDVEGLEPDEVTNESRLRVRGREEKHIVQFYETDLFLSEVVADFLAEGLLAGESVIVIATSAHWQMFRAQLVKRQLDVESATSSGLIAVLDARELLERFMVGGVPDARLFRTALEETVSRSISAAPRAKTRAFGEMVDLLWRDGNSSAALRLEELWNEMQQSHALTLLCAYVMAGFYKQSAGLHELCLAHDDAMPPEREKAVGSTTLDPSTPGDDAARRDEVERALRDVIRELRRAEEELRQSQEQLTDLVENGPVAFNWLDAHGKVVWANRAELDLVGYGKEEYLGRSIADFYVDRNEFEAMFARLHRDETICDFEAQLRRTDGTVRHVVVSANVFRKDGQFHHARCFTRDVTERLLAEERIRRSMQKLQTITDNLPVCVSYVDAEQRYQFVNSTYERWFSMAPGQIVGKTVRELVGDAMYEKLESDIVRALSGETVTVHAQAPLGGRGERFIEAKYVPDRDAGGSVRGFIALVTDITEQKRSEELRDRAARRNERLMRITAAIAQAVTPEQVFEAVVDQVAAALEAKTGALWLLQDDTRIARLLHSVGYSEAARRKFAEVALDSPTSLPVVDTILTGEPLWLGSWQELLERYPHLAEDNVRGPLYRATTLPIVLHGRTLGTLAFCFESGLPLDADERAFLMLVARYSAQALERLRLFEAEQQSRRSAELLYGLLDHVMSARDIDEVFAAALDTLERAVGARRAAILCHDADGVMKLRSWRGLSDAYRRTLEGHSPWPRELEELEPVLVADVEKDAGWASFLPLFRGESIGALLFIPLVAGGRLVGKFLVHYDRPRLVSPQELDMSKAIANHVASAIARFAATTELEQAVRFHEMFTAILGHDLRNPLAAIIAVAQIAGRRPENERETRTFTRIVNSGERMSRMIDQLLDFTRVRIGKGIPLRPSASDLMPLLRQVADELNVAHPDWTLEIDAVGDLEGAWDHDRLGQIFSNLIGNAIQNGDCERGVRVRADGTNPETVRVDIHNMGVVPPELLPKLFDPMTGSERRREKSHGLGLGLFISQQIARAHGGTIHVQSNPVAGTTFTLTLPRSLHVGSIRPSL